MNPRVSHFLSSFSRYHLSISMIESIQISKQEVVILTLATPTHSQLIPKAPYWYVRVHVPPIPLFSSPVAGGSSRSILCKLRATQPFCPVPGKPLTSTMPSHDPLLWDIALRKHLVLSIIHRSGCPPSGTTGAYVVCFYSRMLCCCEIHMALVQ